MRASINPLIEKMRGSPKPIVVAVNGPAAGAGAGIAPAGDIVVAACASLFREAHGISAEAYASSTVKGVLRGFETESCFRCNDPLA
jgi:hypothetical protein